MATTSARVGRVQSETRNRSLGRQSLRKRLRQSQPAGSFSADQREQSAATRDRDCSRANPRRWGYSWGNLVLTCSDAFIFGPTREKHRRAAIRKSERRESKCLFC